MGKEKYFVFITSGYDIFEEILDTEEEVIESYRQQEELCKKYNKRDNRNDSFYFRVIKGKELEIKPIKIETDWKLEEKVDDSD